MASVLSCVCVISHGGMSISKQAGVVCCLLTFTLANAQSNLTELPDGMTLQPRNLSPSLYTCLEQPTLQTNSGSTPTFDIFARARRQRQIASHRGSQRRHKCASQGSAGGNFNPEHDCGWWNVHVFELRSRGLDANDQVLWCWWCYYRLLQLTITFFVSRDSWFVSRGKDVI